MPLLIAFLALLVWFFVFLFKKAIEHDKKRKAEGPKPKKSKEYIDHIKLPYVWGLDLPESFRHLPDKYSVFDIFYAKNGVTIKTSQQDFFLPIEKILDISFMREQQAEKIIAPSLGGAMLGGVFFGTAGAIAGGASRTQTVYHNVTYFVISYKSHVRDDEIKYIIFNATGRFNNGDYIVRQFRGVKRKRKKANNGQLPDVKRTRIDL